MTARTLGTTYFWAIESRLYLFIPVGARVTWSAVLAPITVLHAYFITVRSVIKSVLELFLQTGGSGTETMPDSEREWATCGSQQKQEKSTLQKTGKKGATRGTKTETTGPYEATKPCPVQRSGQGHDWSLETGKTNYKYWRSNRTKHLSETTETVFTRSKFQGMVIAIRGILRTRWHSGALMITLLDQPVYRAVQRLRVSKSISYQGFLERITTRFDSGKSTGVCKMLFRARQQRDRKDIEAYADNLKAFVGCRRSPRSIVEKRS